MTVNANLDLILRRYEELGSRLSAGVAGAEYAKLSRELAELEPIAAAIRTLRAKERESAELDAMLADPSLDAEPDPATPPPAEPERIFPVETSELLVGRRDDRQQIRPAVALHDPGASRRHARFLLERDGTVSLHDLGSTNGTKLNGQDVVSGSIRRLTDGDEVTLGRWTRIRLKARP